MKKRGKSVDGHPGAFKDPAIGRVYTIHPNNNECFHLRLLLHHVKGPTSFESLRTVMGMLHPTYKSACKALGLLEDDGQWEQTLQEAVVSDSPRRLREWFSVLVVFCNPNDPLDLWNKFQDSLTEDYLREARQANENANCENTPYLYDLCLRAIENITLCIGNKSLHECHLPSPAVDHINIDYIREISYNVDELLLYVSENEPHLSNKQFNVYQNMLSSVNYIISKEMFFLNAPGGTGKTFLIKLILPKIRSQGKIAIAVAPSGIALPFFQAVKQHIRCLKYPSTLKKWKPLYVQYLETLELLREGQLEETDGLIDIPSNIGTIIGSQEELIEKVFPGVHQLLSVQSSWLCDRAILTPTNEIALRINKNVLSLFEAEERTYLSVNSHINQDDCIHYPIEFLDSITAPGLPAHELILKVGAPIMLLRNIHPPKLCNGTRLRVRALHRFIIEAEILTCCAAGEIVFIPGIPLIPTNYSFEFRRLQFPISLCFAMTINKSQGQTMSTVGIALSESEFFSHGEFYVAISRVGSTTSIFIYAPTGRTRNVVYKEVLMN
ncbi:uncharacterized protein LOC122507577 [Leptopilina heterotoma]|uniref:uncharacterized protein LOC122507577 n=1 Tax=Leptopilina heterotoma TaxID=63436 RepID=UPI001CA8A8F3|nr:uncharacterized protein LOC122507577 [Leptopilina heterotoma]